MVDGIWICDEVIQFFLPIDQMMQMPSTYLRQSIGLNSVLLSALA